MRKIQIITGASSGMGREYALQLSESNIQTETWLFARREEDLMQVSEELISSSNKSVIVRVFSLDIAGKIGCESVLKILKTEYKKEAFVIETLVNNAGFGTYGTFLDTEIERQLSMIDINVYTLTALCHFCLDYMKEGSSIINVASLGSFLPLGNFAVYAASKAYVLSFTAALAAELADKKIYVQALCPGPVSTNFANVASKGAREKVLHGKSAKKVVQHSLKCMKKKKHFAIMAFKWKFKAFMSRFVGRYAGARFTFLYCKRPSN